MYLKYLSIYNLIILYLLDYENQRLSFSSEMYITSCILSTVPCSIMLHLHKKQNSQGPSLTPQPGNYCFPALARGGRLTCQEIESQRLQTENCLAREQRWGRLTGNQSTPKKDHRPSSATGSITISLFLISLLLPSSGDN